MKISGTQTIPSTTAGKAFVLTVSGFNGHSVSIQYLDDFGNWITALNGTFTANFDKIINPPGAPIRLEVTGGTGQLSMTKADAVLRN